MLNEENIQLLIYAIGTIGGIIAFWYSLRSKVNALEQKINILEVAVEGLKKDREVFEANSKTEIASLRERIENVDKSLVKISTSLEINNQHVGTMIEIITKRLEKIER